MNLNANIETAENVREKAKAAFGFDMSSALDLVKRSDYDSDEAYLDAAAKAELERSSPEYRAARSRLKAEYRARQEKEQRTAQNEAYKSIRAEVLLDALDRRKIDEQAADLARRDLAANRIAASELGRTVERYAQKLGEKRKDEKASGALFNAMLRGQKPYTRSFMRENKKRRCGACTASQRYMIFNRLGDTQSHLSEG